MPEAGSCLPSDAKRVLISVNPVAGSRTASSRVNSLVQLLRQKGLHVDVSTDLDKVASQANRWHAAGDLRALVGVGGDGTAAELVNRTAPGVPITMFPSGNENLLARYLRLGTSPEACCRTIAAGVVRRLDAARAGRRIFLLMAGCGFDAEVVRRVHAGRKGHIGRATYLGPILASIRNYAYPELRVYWGEESDGVEVPLCVRWLFAFNLPCYGGGLRLAPQADGSDGLLDVCTFHGGGLWCGLRYAVAVAFQRHHRMADFAVRRVRQLRIVADAEVPYQLDGDPGGMLPVEIEALPDRLTVVVPEHTVPSPAGRGLG